MTVTIAGLEKIEKARLPKELFPPGCDVDKRFKELAKTCHPDVASKTLRDRATAAYQKLSQFRQELNVPEKILKIGPWTINGPFEKGDIADLYLATKDGVSAYVLKIARSTGDKDLMDREQKALDLFFKDGHGDGKNFHKYLHQVQDSFTATRRRVHVFPYHDAAVSLEQILLQVKKLDFRHAVWMFNRLLSVLGYTHRHGIVHGAILPKHLLYVPKTHGLHLVDWCYSAHVSKEHIPAVVKGCEEFYPKEVRMKRPHLETDIYMAAKCIENIGGIPREFKPILEYCLAESPNARPNDAWLVQGKWQEAAKKVYGEPKFVALELPKN